MSSKCKNTATEAYVALAKRPRSEIKCRTPKSNDIITVLNSKVELSTNSSSSTFKLDFVEDLGLPHLPLTGLLHFNHVAETKLVFLRKVKNSLVDKLENLGCMGLFDVSNEVYPQLFCLLYANFEKVEPKGRSGTYCTIKVRTPSSLSPLN